MTHNEMQNFLAAQGWKDSAAKDLCRSKLVKWSLPLNKWRQTFGHLTYSPESRNGFRDYALFIDF